jgi:hypothetical protein
LNQDFYKPTTSELADPAEAPRERPRAVNLALASAGLALLILLLGKAKILQEAQFRFDDPRGWLMTAGELIVFGVLVLQLAHGRHWARIIFLVLIMGSFVSLCWNIGYIVRHMPMEASMLLAPRFLVMRVVPLALNLLAAHLLWFSSGHWFEPRPR